MGSSRLAYSLAGWPVNSIKWAWCLWKANLSLKEAGLEPLEGQLEPFEGQLKPLGGQLEPLGGRLELLGGWLEPLRGQCEPHGGQLVPLRGQLAPQGGQQGSIKYGFEVLSGCIWSISLGPLKYAKLFQRHQLCTLQVTGYYENVSLFVQFEIDS